MTGTVKWFDMDRAFGFVTIANEAISEKRDVFAHIRDVRGNNKTDRVLYPGDTVEFEIVPTPRGDRAKNVVVIKRQPQVSTVHHHD